MRTVILSVVQALFRMVPQPTKPRLMQIGRPGRNAPVLVTTNCSATVRMLRKALRGVDCFLLVAPAQGINVWCGSVGGHFNVDSVLSILKTSGIESQVEHRSLILPQLAAPSIDIRELRRRCGWTATFGPVSANDIPEFLERGTRAANRMRLVQFPNVARAEMALAMTGSIVLRFSLVPLVVWGLYGVLFFCLAVLAISAIELRRHGKDGRGSERTCMSHRGLGFAPGNVFAAVLPALPVPLFSLNLIHSQVAELSIVGIGLATGALILVRNAAPGYAPYRQCSYSKLFYGLAPLSIQVEAIRCVGCELCEQVCPVGCFEETTVTPRLFDIVRKEDCVECGACLIQCPTGAVVNADLEHPTKSVRGNLNGPTN